MEQLKHFLHDHPLILNNSHAKDNASCFICHEEITKGTSVYYCNNSADDCNNLFMHKSCAELPEKIDYPMHPQHTLVQSLKRRIRTCDVCAARDNVYTCRPCRFDVCLSCYYDKDHNFRHQGHSQHTLTLLPREAKFFCNACATIDLDFSYVCNVCPFWMHKECAETPTILKCKFHEHDLVLAYSFPEKYLTFMHYCSICDETLARNFWVYYCVNCRFFAHIKCCTSTDIDPMLILRSSEKEDFGDSLLHFPLSNELSIEAILQRFTKASNLTDNTTTTASNQINHAAHIEHTLILYDEEHYKKHTNNGQIVVCDGCVRPMVSSDQFYGCLECSFFLHKFCANVPQKLQHSLHPQHDLIFKITDKPVLYFFCSFCSYYSSGMCYLCETCNFCLDIRCAFLPTTTIKHEAHRHALHRVDQVSEVECKGLEAILSSSMSFSCKVCPNYNISTVCAYMPKMVWHRWDPHPVSLVYPPIKDHPDVFYCEMCEEEINPNYWLYHCRLCDQSFHPLCLSPFFAYSNIKFGANDIQVQMHPHNLTFVGTQKHKAPPHTCSKCGSDIPDGFPVLKCEPCHFRLCMMCYYTRDQISLKGTM